MKRGIAVKDGRAFWQMHQNEREVGAVLDMNHFIRNNPTSSGGTGSKDMKFVARIPEAANAQFMYDWRMKGGQAGTGMTCTEYCILQASLPDYEAFVTTPSGKTGYERGARRFQMGYTGKRLKLDNAPRKKADKIIFKDRDLEQRAVDSLRRVVGR